eukprot:Opistho-2@4619
MVWISGNGTCVGFEFTIVTSPPIVVIIGRLSVKEIGPRVPSNVMLPPTVVRTGAEIMLVSALYVKTTLPPTCTRNGAAIDCRRAISWTTTLPPMDARFGGDITVTSGQNDTLKVPPTVTRDASSTLARLVRFDKSRSPLTVVRELRLPIDASKGCPIMTRESSSRTPPMSMLTTASLSSTHTVPFGAIDSAPKMTPLSFALRLMTNPYDVTFVSIKKRLSKDMLSSTRHVPSTKPLPCMRMDAATRLGFLSSSKSPSTTVRKGRLNERSALLSETWMGPQWHPYVSPGITWGCTERDRRCSAPTADDRTCLMSMCNDAYVRSTRDPSPLTCANRSRAPPLSSMLNTPPEAGKEPRLRR